jgi:hypothetical protein
MCEKLGQMPPNLGNVDSLPEGDRGLLPHLTKVNRGSWILWVATCKAKYRFSFLKKNCIQRAEQAHKHRFKDYWRITLINWEGKVFAFMWDSNHTPQALGCSHLHRFNTHPKFHFLDRVTQLKQQVFSKESKKAEVGNKFEALAS